MKLTHENARALLDELRLDHPDCGCKAEGYEEECPWTAAKALAEQWLAAHTVRWDGRKLRLGTGVVVGRAQHGNWGRGWRMFFARVSATAETEAEARAWCEERALGEGYEVER